MFSDTQVSKWGNSLAIRIPQAVLKAAQLAEGDRLALDVNADGSIVLRAMAPRYTLDELVAGITPKNRHEAADWGKPQGEESW
ncbi:MAG: AbrB/MazE/SpoVT family DNA-binding domain-containing protein [Acidobacteria bacterium]|nr:AbrB/MazE/SpoVT family DNA-binding domain-containing protein [Acidobacteriota bacterium]